jgi:hypothetical protein
MMSRVREKIPILKLLSKTRSKSEKMLVPGRGKGGECPGTSVGQAVGLTAGVEAAETRPMAGAPATLAASRGWLIDPTRIANAPAALNAKVAAWANIGFMIFHPVLTARHILRRFDQHYAGGVPIAEKGGNACNFTPKSHLCTICLANHR